MAPDIVQLVKDKAMFVLVNTVKLAPGLLVKSNPTAPLVRNPAMTGGVSGGVTVNVTVFVANTLDESAALTLKLYDDLMP